MSLSLPKPFGVAYFGACAFALALGCFFVANEARADQGGVSFWLPGLFGSLAATPQQPGWSLGTIYYHTSVTGGADVTAARAITIGRFNPTLNVNLSGNVNADADIGLIAPSYVFATPFLGGQAAVTVLAVVGGASTSLNATLSSTLGPFALPSRSLSLSDSVAGFGDLAPEFTVRWNAGVHNFMTYITGDVPVGAYDSTRLANLGIGHGTIDGGGGYTYFNPQTGHEFSAVLGFTGNFVNPSSTCTSIGARRSS